MGVPNCFMRWIFSMNSYKLNCTKINDYKIEATMKPAMKANATGAKADHTKKRKNI